MNAKWSCRRYLKVNFKVSCLVQANCVVYILQKYPPKAVSWASYSIGWSVHMARDCVKNKCSAFLWNISYVIRKYHVKMWYSCHNTKIILLLNYSFNNNMMLFMLVNWYMQICISITNIYFYSHNNSGKIDRPLSIRLLLPSFMSMNGLKGTEKEILNSFTICLSFSFFFVLYNTKRKK